MPRSINEWARRTGREARRDDLDTSLGALDLDDRSSNASSDVAGTSTVRRHARGDLRRAQDDSDTSSTASSEITATSTVDWDSGRHLPSRNRGSWDDNHSSISSASYRSTVGGNFFRPGIAPSHLKSNPLPVQTFYRLKTFNDDSALQVILVLVHDCLVALDRIRVGKRPRDIFEDRYRLLSLYIIAGDLIPFDEALRTQGLKHRYGAMEKLIILREKLLFPNAEEPQIRDLGRRELHSLRRWISEVLREYPVEMVRGLPEAFVGLLRSIDSYLSKDVMTDEYPDVCRSIRAFLDIRPFTDPTTSMVPVELTHAEEVLILHDMLLGFWGHLTLSLNGSLRGPFCSLKLHKFKSRWPHIQHLVFCRDVMCGLLSGPSTLTAKSGYLSYGKVLFTSLRAEWCLWQHLTSEQRHELDVLVEDFGLDYEYDQHRELGLFTIAAILLYFQTNFPQCCPKL